MIQAIQASPSVGQIQPAQAAAPVKAAQVTAPLQAFSTDALQLRAKAFTDEEAIAALNALRQKYGDIHKSGFFSSPKIDNNEALSRLKSGKDIFIKVKSAGDHSSYFDSLDELMLLDDLQGRGQDHGVAKPELRLPLRFLAGQKLEKYNSNSDEDARIDAYTAYDQLKRDWRIVINGKDVKPKDLIAYVVSQGWTASADPGLALRAQFARLPAAGWKLNGQDVSRDLAYMAWISGDRRLSLDGAAVASEQDFAILQNLTANEPNNAVDADLRARLLRLNLGQFSSPVANYYSVYKHLETGRALSYAGNTLHSLSELKVYDALAGSLKPTPELPAAQYDALSYLARDKGLSSANAFQAWQQLSAGQRVSYTFNGGPTGEAISFSAASLAELLTLKAQVVAQRERDQYRPDLNQAKQIVAERAPQLQASLSQNLERTRAAVERARADVPVQQARLDQARQDYDRIRPVWEQAQRDYQYAQRSLDDAQRRYDSDRRSYEWERDKYNRLERDYQNAQRNSDQALNQARRLDDQARQEDALAGSDPNNAAAHRQKAQDYRNQANNARNQAQRYQQEAGRLRGEMDRQRWDMQRAERDMQRSQSAFYDARSNCDSKRNLLQQEQSRLDEASTRMRQAENQLRIAQQTIHDGDVIEKVSLDASQQLQSLQAAMNRIKSWSGYPAERQALQNAIQQLAQAVDDETYTRVHGADLAHRTAPLQTLIQNLDKPAQK